MKPSTKINILGWCMVGWGMVGLLRGYVAVILILAGIGILLKKNIARIVMMYFSFFAVCMSILGIIGFSLAVIIPRLLLLSEGGVNQPENPNAILLGIGMLLMFIVLGLLDFYIYKLLKKKEIIAEFIKAKN